MLSCLKHITKEMNSTMTLFLNNHASICSVEMAAGSVSQPEVWSEVWSWANFKACHIKHLWVSMLKTSQSSEPRVITQPLQGDET